MTGRCWPFSATDPKVLKDSLLITSHSTSSVDALAKHPKRAVARNFALTSPVRNQTALGSTPLSNTHLFLLQFALTPNPFRHLDPVGRV